MYMLQEIYRYMYILGITKAFKSNSCSKFLNKSLASLHSLYSWLWLKYQIKINSSEYFVILKHRLSCIGVDSSKNQKKPRELNIMLIAFFILLTYAWFDDFPLIFLKIFACIY